MVIIIVLWTRTLSFSSSPWKIVFLFKVRDVLIKSECWPWMILWWTRTLSLLFNIKLLWYSLDLFFGFLEFSPMTLSRHFPYRSSPLAGLLGNIPYPHIAAVCMFELVVLLLPGHMWGVHRSTSLMCSSLLLQQCPAYQVRLTWIVFVMGGRWPYSWCLVWCCLQDLFNIARNILV